MLSKKLQKIFSKEANHLLDDMDEFRKNHKRISDSIAESKKRMDEKAKKRRLIQNK
ncbi:hypothetical protein PDQ74_15950 [Bacillus cereus group sp. Bc005]|uniref:hypothetical protein n=1 Tax=Bacillus cereus group TaxID=86661 RepID=UPI0005DDE694|nr:MULTISPECIES: hypothetical protein [Bacillus cereus group]CKF01496.1 Uncharacterised protein [Streptococcus pneumoniae]MDA1510826.1 hypothetical protein [Bacillus cereus group sp. TH36-2LC]MDA2194510.1 hypothetical protein [Bacillus cereus group sp. Bc238]MDA2200274.1 hypothetical protein [Bacillus cereus group sp. Bc237]MDA2758310.1 hypothetical protein [Bacillus cereus group sp. Bc007]